MKTLSRLGKMTVEMWRDMRPNMVEELEKKGMLEEIVYQVQEKALDEIAELIGRGVPEYMARERVVEMLRLPSEEEHPGEVKFPFL